MNTRSDPAGAAPATPVAAAVCDAFTSRWTDWWRQFEQVQASSLTGLAALFEATAARAASAQGWARWFDVAGAFSSEAMEEAAKHQAEWLAALTQCQMQSAKMLVDLGWPPGAAAPARAGEAAAPFGELLREASAACAAPWMALAGVRPVQIA